MIEEIDSRELKYDQTDILINKVGISLYKKHSPPGRQVLRTGKQVIFLILK